MKRRGVGLGVTLVIVALLAVVGFTLAALTVGRIQLLGNLQHKRQARQLAMSAIQAALGKLGQQPQYGLNSNDPQIQVNSEDPNNRGRLCFNPGQAAQFGIPASVNNLQGLSAVSAPQNVPASSARLVAEGRYGGSRELLEALITQPVFPFALASTGPIHSSRGLIVATLPDDSETSRQNLLSDPARYGKPANLLGNSGALDSVQILGPSTICGDLQSSGHVDLSGNPIQILGELREEREPEPLPDIPLAALRPQSPQTISGAPSNAPTLQGAVLCNGPFSCTGDLKLEGANLYVKGDLNVGGELQGAGTITVEGATHLRGSANLNSLGRVAVVSQGDLTLLGTGSTHSFFKGIVYTRGKLTANGLMVYGCLLAAAPGPSAGPQIDLQDCVVVQETGAVVDQSAPPVVGSGSITMQTSDNGGTFSLSQDVGAKVRLLPSQRLHFSLTTRRTFQGNTPPDPPTEYEVQFNRPSSIRQFVQQIRSHYANAADLSMRVGPPTAPSVNPVQNDLIKVNLDLTDPTRLQTQLVELASRLGGLGETTNLFDLNQFLRTNDRLRIASCRSIH